MFAFLNRKSRNRRLNSGSVLDVKLRSDQVRTTRMRAAAIGLGLMFATIFSVCLLWAFGEWSLRQLIFENPAFAITSVDVRTDGLIGADQIRRWAGVNGGGGNLMALDLAEVKRRLEFVPLIKSVSVERVLPRTLRIRVFEREPIAQVNVPHVRSGGGLDIEVRQLDAEGFVMLPLDPRLRNTPLGQSESSLPVLTGVNPLALQVGRQVDSAQVRAALELVAQFNESPMTTFADLKRLDLTTPEVLIVTTGQGAVITFGMQEISRQLLRWSEIHEQGMRYNRAIASLDLAVSNNIPARWLDASLQPPRAPQSRPVKPPRSITNRRRSA